MREGEIAKSIISELAYFDIFEYPLTAMEIWRYCRVDNATLVEIMRVLEKDPGLNEKVANRHGFYFLKGRRHIVETRLTRYRDAEAKFNKALKFVRRLSKFPFIRMIAVCNSLAYSNTRKQSDIDLFIVTESGRIWTSRMYITGWLKMLGVRPEGRNTENKLCASFFVTSNGLDLKSILFNKQDIYLAHWLLQVFPLYDPDKIYEKFLNLNSWARQLYPNAYAVEPAPTRRIESRTSCFKKTTEKIHSGLIGNYIEKKYRDLQLRLLPKNLKAIANKDTRVRLSDTMLKFHYNDRREKYQAAWREKLKNLSI